MHAYHRCSINTFRMQEKCYAVSIYCKESLFPLPSSSQPKFKVILVCHLVARVGNEGIFILQAQFQEALWLGLITAERKKGDFSPWKSSAQRGQVSQNLKHGGSPGSMRRGIQPLGDRKCFWWNREAEWTQFGNFACWDKTWEFLLWGSWDSASWVGGEGLFPGLPQANTPSLLCVFNDSSLAFSCL